MKKPPNLQTWADSRDRHTALAPGRRRDHRLNRGIERESPTTMTAKTLAELIGEAGYTYAVLSKRSGLTTSLLNRLGQPHQPPRMPARETIKKLATGLDVPASVVVDAIATSMGFSSPEASEPITDADVERLLAFFTELSRAGRRSVLDHAAELHHQEVTTPPADRERNSHTLPDTNAAGHLRCAECGKYWRNLSNHVKAHRLTPSAYRRRHGLAPDQSLVSAPQHRYEVEEHRNRNGRQAVLEDGGLRPLEGP